MTIKLQQLTPVKKIIKIGDKSYTACGWTLEAMHYIANQYKGGLQAFYKELGKNSPKDLLYGFYAILRCDSEFLKDFPAFEDFTKIKYHHSIADYLIRSINDSIPVNSDSLKKKILTIATAAVMICAGLLFMTL